MSNPDSQFINRFSVIIGLLVVIAIALVFLSRIIMDASPTADEPAVRATGAAAATTPAADATTAATATAANATPAATAGEQAAGADGEAVYTQVCSVCHGTGIAGAPKVGDAGAWKARIAQGKATLYDHALHGLTTKTGVMAPKAGRSDLSDASVEAAVDYMVAKSGG